jgi:hypothetical protein
MDYRARSMSRWAKSLILSESKFLYCDFLYAKGQYYATIIVTANTGVRAVQNVKVCDHSLAGIMGLNGTPNPYGGMNDCFLCCVDKGLYDGPIIRPGEPYRIRVSHCVMRVIILLYTYNGTHVRLKIKQPLQ